MTSSIDILSQDIAHIGHQLKDTQEQIERIRRLIKFDEREAAVGESKDRSKLLDVVAQNTAAVTKLTRLMIEQSASGDPGTELFYSFRAARDQEVSKNMRHIQRLTRCTQRTVSRCPCGKHKGIVFLEETSAIHPGDKVFVIPTSEYGIVEYINGEGIATVNQKIANKKDLLLVVDMLCPVNWWIKQARLDHYNKKGTKFVDLNPMGEFVNKYSL